MYRGSSSLGCGTVQVTRVWFIPSHPSHCHPTQSPAGIGDGGWPHHHWSRHGDRSRPEPPTRVQGLLAQAGGGGPAALGVTFCGCAVSAPAAAGERPSWTLPRWKRQGWTNRRKHRLLQSPRQECWASRRKGHCFRSPLLPGRACFARRWAQEFLRTRACCWACWAR